MSKQASLFDAPAPPVKATLEYRAPFAKDSDTSRAAAASVEHGAESLCAVIFAAIKAAGDHGMTCFEVEERFALKHQTASARLWDLHTKTTVLMDSGRRRPTSSGRKAVVWIVAK